MHLSPQKSLSVCTAVHIHSCSEHNLARLSTHTVAVRNAQRSTASAQDAPRHRREQLPRRALDHTTALAHQAAPLAGNAHPQRAPTTLHSGCDRSGQPRTSIDTTRAPQRPAAAVYSYLTRTNTQGLPTLSTAQHPSHAHPHHSPSTRPTEPGIWPYAASRRGCRRRTAPQRHATISRWIFPELALAHISE